MRRGCLFGAAWTAVAVIGVGSSARAEPSVHRAAGSRSVTLVDPALVPAGGPQCRHCGTGACQLHRGHAADCRDGLCTPHCPVRPSQYGFYRTQWRRWPDQGVTPVSAEEAATPAPPAKSLVPSADEESPRSPGGEAAPNDMQAAEGTPPSAQPVAPTRDAGALPADPIPENPAGEDAGRPDGGGRAGSEQDGRMSRQPSAEQSMPPQPESAVRRADQSSVPGEEAERLIEAGPLRLRYPAQVGRSLAAGAVPWRLQPAAPQ